LLGPAPVQAAGPKHGNNQNGINIEIILQLLLGAGNCCCPGMQPPPALVPQLPPQQPIAGPDAHKGKGPQMGGIQGGKPNAMHGGKPALAGQKPHGKGPLAGIAGQAMKPAIGGPQQGMKPAITGPSQGKPAAALRGPGKPNK
jgi:hypothetical protein